MNFLSKSGSHLFYLNSYERVNEKNAKGDFILQF